MKSSYLNYIDQIEKIIEKIKNLDVDEQIIDLYSELSTPSTQINVLNKVNTILELAKTKTTNKEIIADLTNICNNFSEELKKDNKFDKRIPITKPLEEDDVDDEDEEESQTDDKKSSTTSDIDDLV